MFSQDKEPLMQYFSEGYRPGDPRVRPAAEGRGGEQGPLPAEVDVLIVGSGPAGLLLAAQLSQFPEIVTRVVEKARRPAAGRPGGRRELPHRRDVRGLRSGRQDDRRGLLGQRDPLLGRRPAGQLQDHPPGPHPGRARSALGVPARHRQPGPAAGLPAGGHVATRPAGSRSTTAWRRSGSRSRTPPTNRSPSPCAAAAPTGTGTRSPSAPSTSSAATARTA